jgi:predicted acyl esterase
MRIVLRAIALIAVTWISSSILGQSQDVKPRPGALETPKPKYAVRVEKSVFIPMRDGIQLATDLYFPVGLDTKLPIVLIRTPYGKTNLNYVPSAEFFAGQGFAVAVQDCRGKFESEGIYRFTRGHRTDGYDTIAWLAKQPWSNGKIGTYGCSYAGEVQVYQSPALPPGLAAMIPQASGLAVGAGGSLFHNATDLTGGAWMLSVGLDWFFNFGSKVYYHPPPGYSREEYLSFSKYFKPGPVSPGSLLVPGVERKDLSQILWTLPVIDMMKKADGRPSDYEEYVSHTMDLTDPYWKQFDYVTDADRIDAPALFIESWNDLSADGGLYMRGLFEKTAVSTTSRDNQFIIISPTSHCGSEYATQHTMIGDVDAGDPRFGHFEIYVKWFDHWLRGDSNDVTAMPKIQYYLLVKNEWRATNSWPVPGTQFVNYYLESGGRANSHFGDGTLAVSPPKASAVDTFTYDPGNPVMSIGVNDYEGGKPITDQRPVSARHDVLAYTSPPIDKGFEMTGPIGAVLYVSSSAKDTDFVAKLVDVYPDGRALNLRENVIRARFRQGRDKPPVFMKPGEVYEVRINLGAYSWYFEPGHRIRLQVTSSSFPRYDRNLNTGGHNYDETEWIVAQNSVHHAPSYPSRIILPVVK